jgi:tetratricopeptide (TPR) repeat protein
MSLDPNLVEEIRGGRAVLFLGAGASLGASDGQGHDIPGTEALGKSISKAFLGDGITDLDFVQICDYAATAKSGRELQRYIHDTLNPFQPTHFHRKVPTFHWAGMATTNFDLIVERAYEEEPARLQRLRPLVRDTPDFMDSLEKGDLLYLKLHGCISAFEQLSPGMVYSTERILRHKEGRAAQFSQLLEWARQKTLIFAGYSLRDYNLRLLLDEIIKDGDARPRHYIIKRGVLDVERQYWVERRFTLIDSTFEAFIDELDASIPGALRKLAIAKSEQPTSLTTYIASHRRESTLLRNYLETGAEHVSTETASTDGTPQRFFNGFDLGWYPIEKELDFPRFLTQTILEEQVVVPGQVNGPRLVVLKAHAGAGKSVMLRRLAWDAARRLRKLVVFVPSTGYINVEALQELVSLAQEPLFLVIDDITQMSDAVAGLLAAAKRENQSIIVIGGARFNEWNIRSQVLDSSVSAEYELRYMSRKETEDLLVQLELNDCLGELKHLPHDQQLKQLEEIYGRQLLVALHEATRNGHFRDVIYDEYSKIVPAEAQVLYADICALHRFGSPVRAGLISRVHGINFEQFEERFFRPLEQVVSLELDVRIGDWIYRSRHPYIAEILYSQVFRTEDERLDNLAKFITRLNPAYSYDRRIIGDLLRGSKLADLLTETHRGLALYDLAISALGEEHHVFHQKGIYLMKLANDIQGLSLAEDALLRAAELAPADRTIRHSIAELALTRARMSTDSIERAAWRNEAISKAQSLLAASNGSYAYHTIAKAHIQALSDAMDSEGDDQLSADVVSNAIKLAEDTIRSGLKRFPGDSHLLTEEATLAHLLENDERAERALHRAFESNKKSHLIAKRYAVVLRARGKIEDAREVLRQALEYNPGSQDLNFDFAQISRAIDPSIDAERPEFLLSYYQRSFAKGDKNYRAQLLCARQLSLAGRHPEAKSLYDNLKAAQVPFGSKNAVKEEVLQEGGEARHFNGIVTKRFGSYGFIELDHHRIHCYFDNRSMRDKEELPSAGDRVSVTLGFSFFGPAARNLILLT